VILEGVNGGAQVLVFQTNNADFRGTDENLQQLAFARMRAIETGRSVVNVSTVGASQIIRPDGSTLSRLSADEAGAMLEDVELRSGLTAGVILGPWVQQLLLWGGLVMLVVGWWRSRRRTPN
jgi:apolipoprotein N-acyltransferase